jgi:RNA polymerase sigma-70 factor (ECF subfamily)
MAPRPIEDAELTSLLARCGRREHDALSVLYRATGAHLLGCLMRILRRRALAEEALQDVFVQVWERADQYEQHRGRPYAWMVSIARYRAIDILRRERADQVDPFQLAETLTAQHDDPPPGDAAALATCMDQLDTEQRRSIELAFLGGQSHPQVAQAMQRPLGSVKSWIRRGLLSLKECLEACNVRTTT